MPAQVTNSVPKLPVEQAAAKLIQMGVRTSKDFILLSKGEYEGVERPADVPANPLVHYDVDGFDDFIRRGREYIDSGKEVSQLDVPDYEGMKLIVRELDITSHRQWMKAVREGRLPGRCPTQPDKYYTDWKGWADFLAPVKDRFLSFEEAREKARELASQYDMSKAKDWRMLSRRGHRPKNLPSNPSEYYDEKWLGWDDWFGIKTT